MKELMALPKLEYVNYAPQPLPLCDVAIIRPLPLSDMNDHISIYRGSAFTWTENIWIPDEWVINNIDQMKLDEIGEKLIPWEAFCACHMNDEVGHGVYTLQAIPRGDILLYSGIIKPYEHQELHYGMQTGGGYVVDGQAMSGFADLFQDLYEPSLDAVDWAGKAAVNNFTAKTLALSCGTVTLLEAKSDILPRVQCGVSYGAQFWKMQYMLHNVQKRFFTEQGELI